MASWNNKAVMLALLGLSTAFSACGSRNRTQRSLSPRAGIFFPTGGTSATIKSDINGVIVATLDPNSATAQVVKASANSNIKDVSIAFPPGALAIATDISLQEGETFSASALTAAAGVADGTSITQAAAPVTVLSSQPIDLKVPMVIALSLPSGAGLAAGALPIERMGVIFRVLVQATGERLAGVVPAASLTIQGGRLLYPSNYFGWFQVTVFDKPIVESKQADSQSLYQALVTIFAGQALPACGQADVGRTIYSQDQKTFLYCTATGWTALDLKGPAGATGATGATGAAGAAAGTQMFSVYDQANSRVGTLLSLLHGNYPDYTSIVVGLGSSSAANNGTVTLSLETGAFKGGPCTNRTQFSNGYANDLGCYCLYADAACTTPASACNVAGRPSKDGIFKMANGSWVRASGSETSASSTGLAYYYNGSSCLNYGYGVTSSYYTVTTSYTYPTGIPAIPAANPPLYVDP